jgi:hypothetical protein
MISPNDLGQFAWLSTRYEITRRIIDFVAEQL